MRAMCVAALGAALLMAGCGSSSSGDDSTASVTTASGVPAATAPTGAPKSPGIKPGAAPPGGKAVAEREIRTVYEKAITALLKNDTKTACQVFTKKAIDAYRYGARGMLSLDSNPSCQVAFSVISSSAPKGQYKAGEKLRDFAFDGKRASARTATKAPYFRYENGKWRLDVKPKSATRTVTTTSAPVAPAESGK